MATRAKSHRPGISKAPAHRPKPRPVERPEHHRLYNDRRWREASEAFRSEPENACCRECLKRGRVRASKVTDHIIPHRGDESLFWDRENWQALCQSCHSRKTNSREGGRRR